MRTAIFVYQTTSIDLSTSESGLQLCGLSCEAVSLAEGQSQRTFAPGVYKIVSSQEVQVTGDSSAFDVIIVPNDKTDIPPLPASRANTVLAPLDVFALQAFFAVPDAKRFVNP